MTEPVYPDVVSGSKLLLQIGDGADPEVFATRCMINTTRSISFSATMINDNIPPCDEEHADDPAWTSSEVDVISCAIEGSGFLDAGDVDFFFNWLSSGAAKNIKFKVNKTGSSVFTGAFKLSNFAITGERKNKATCTISLVNDGPVTIAAVA